MMCNTVGLTKKWPEGKGDLGFWSVGECINERRGKEEEAGRSVLGTAAGGKRY